MPRAYKTPENVSEVRRTAWETRRARYGSEGHKGRYKRPVEERQAAQLETAREALRMIASQAADLGEAQAYARAAFREIENERA